MKLTKNSHKLMSFFHKYNCLPEIKQTKTTNAIFKKLFYEIEEAANFVSYTKSQMGHAFYKLKIKKIDNVSQIFKPTTFNVNAFPDKIREHIDEYSLSSLTYSFHLFERDITIHFLIEDDRPEIYIEKYNIPIDEDILKLIENLIFNV